MHTNELVLWCLLSEGWIMPTLPYAFGLSFFYRIVIPGAVATLLILLFKGTVDTLSSLQGITLFVMVTLLVGFVLRIVFPFVSGFLFYGELLPARIRSWKILVLRRELTRAEEALEGSSPAFPSAEAFRRQRMEHFVLNFPFTDGQRFAVAPTVMGNMLASLTAYISKLYSLPELFGSIGYTRDMTTIFIRLWYALDRETRKEVTEALAHLEALLTSLPVLAIGFVAFLAKGLWGQFALQLKESADSALGAAAVLLLLLWIVYRASEKETLSVVMLLEGLFGRDETRGQIDARVETLRRAMKAQKLPGGGS